MHKKSFWHRARVRVRVLLREWRAFWRDFDAKADEYHQARTQHPEFFFERPLD